MALTERHISQEPAGAQATDRTAPATSTAGHLAPVAAIPPPLFGSFVEHLGRCVYGGIYEPGHPTSDRYGFRSDVIDLVRELGVTCVRYPGGNFVSTYAWEDGTGPRDARPIRRDPAWHSTETNQVGIDDFYRWSQEAGTEIMLAVNMGTRGIAAALDELEYVNGAAGTTLADRRISNGITEPMDIRMWCIGNEMDGPWQVGHMTAQEYARAVDKVAHAMKLADSGLELVACGSSNAHMPTFGEWERTVLTTAYDNLDFVSCHAYYFEHGHADLQEFLTSSQDMATFIDTVAGCAREAKEDNGGTHDIALSFDEWGVWYSDRWNRIEAEWKANAAAVHHDPWPKAPHLLEDIYTVADAVVEGSLMIAMLKRCDSVRSASRAQLVNVIAPIMAEPNGPVWRQTVFYPFAEAAHHARGTAYAPRITGPVVHTRAYGAVQAVDAVVTWDEESRTGLILAVNRDAAAEHRLDVDCSTLPGITDDGLHATHAIQLHDADPYRRNTATAPNSVTPYAIHTITGTPATLTFDMPAISWTAVRFTA